CPPPGSVLPRGVSSPVIGGTNGGGNGGGTNGITGYFGYGGGGASDVRTGGCAPFCNLSQRALVAGGGGGTGGSHGSDGGGWGGGGGGGSGYGPAGTTFHAGVQSGNGKIVVSWPTDSVPPVVTISTSGVQAPTGWYNAVSSGSSGISVSVSAADDATGVSNIT